MNAGPPPTTNPLHWFPEYLRFGKKRIRKQARLLCLSILVGLIAGIAAIGFFAATQLAAFYVLEEAVGYHPAPHPAGEPKLAMAEGSDTPFRPWLLLIVPAIGGLVSGMLVFKFAPEAEGHGTDSVIAAYHRKQGNIRPRVPMIKIVASAITLGSGGSGGREGPIAQVGAGFASILGKLLRLSTSERRVLVAAGMGAGVAAIFRAPLAGALFAAEVLYWSPEFEAEVIIPAGISSVVSYCTFGLVYGWRPLFNLSSATFTNPLQLGPYFLLAVAMVALSLIYTRTFYTVTYLFQRVPISRHFKPAIGAGLSGAIGLGLYFLLGEQVLSVLSFGYNGIEYAIDSGAEASAIVLLAIAFGKILTTSLTIGSGGSGGVFGPSMVIGGCGAGSLAVLFHRLWPAGAPSTQSFVVVGMAGFFAAAAKTPFSTLVIVSEMTGGYGLLLPSLWVCLIAFILSDQQSIYSSQVESRSQSPAHQGYYVREVLAEVRISQFLSAQVELPKLSLGDPLPLVVKTFRNSAYPVLPVVDAEQRLLGVINLEEVHLAVQEPELRHLLVAEDLMREDISPLLPTDTLDRGMELFIRNDLLALPIIADRVERKVIGIVSRFEVANTYLQRVHTPPGDPEALGEAGVTFGKPMMRRPG